MTANQSSEGIYNQGATVVISDNTISGNLGTGILSTSGTVLSPGSSVVRQNANDVNGAITSFGKI